jgi:hypothetical protein
MTLLVALTGNTTVRVCKVGKVQTGRENEWVGGWMDDINYYFFKRLYEQI